MATRKMGASRRRVPEPPIAGVGTVAERPAADCDPVPVLQQRVIADVSRPSDRDIVGNEARCDVARAGRRLDPRRPHADVQQEARRTGQRRRTTGCCGGATIGLLLP